MFSLPEHTEEYDLTCTATSIQLLIDEITQPCPQEKRPLCSTPSEIAFGPSLSRYRPVVSEPRLPPQLKNVSPSNLLILNYEYNSSVSEGIMTADISDGVYKTRIVFRDIQISNPVSIYFRFRVFFMAAIFCLRRELGGVHSH
jgi:hypothetical protein